MTELRGDPKISFVVPVYKVPKATFKRCLMSLTNQDYENKEIVVVFDGPDEELLAIAKPFSDEFKYVKIIEKEHAGACETRNRGFQESIGEIISFFHSDYIAKPGMARLWVDKLIDNPECGFVYGPYEYATSSRYVYRSKPFDEYLLEQSNYIDAGFPLWRRYVVEWDPKVKSLQDWDFWLRVVKTHKIKGHFLGRDVSYIAEPPRSGGLSMDSSSNWVDRVSFVKEKNGIKEYPIVVTSIGAANHGKMIAQMIGADFRDGDTILKPNKYKAVYMIGFYLKPTDIGNMHPQVMAHFDKQVRIIHFVGADIFHLKKFTYQDLNMIANAMNNGADHVLCENEMAHEELRLMGINSEIVPIPPYTNLDVKPLPDKFSVAIYLTNQSDFDKYCSKETLSIVRALPHIQFNAYGDARPEYMMPNLKVYGNLTKDQWTEFVYSNSAYLRLVRHDTRPMATDEFIMAGRSVITNVPNPYIDYIDTKGDQQGSWDIFQVGLNEYNWPKTKKAVIKKILEVRNNPKSEEVKNLYSGQLKELLNKETYIEKIKKMAETSKIKQGVN